MSTAVAGVTPVHGFHGSEKAAGRERGNGFFIEDTEEEEEGLSESSSIGASSSESSSIGENSSSEAGEKGGEEEEEEEVESKAKEGLGSLEALEDSLPIKRGLSNFYAGKSKSFTSLAEAAATAAAKEIEKPENPFNKRRRVLAAWSRRRASCSSLATAYLPPLLAPDHAVVEEEEDEEDDDEEEDQPSNYQPKEKGVPTFPPPRLSVHTTQRGMVSRSTTFRSPRSFSLSDLHNASYNQL